MPNVRMLAFFRFARRHGLGGIRALQHLPPGLFLTANDHTALVKEAERAEIEGTHVVRLSLKVWGVAVEPIATPVRCEVRRIEHPPETRPTHRPGVARRQGGDPVVETPACGGTGVLGRLTRGHCHHIQTRGGGKSAAAALAAAHLAGQGGPAQESADANAPRDGGYTAIRWPLADAMGAPTPQPGGSLDNERPRRVVWNGHVRSTPTGPVRRESR